MFYLVVKLLSDRFELVEAWFYALLGYISKCGPSGASTGSLRVCQSPRCCLTQTLPPVAGGTEISAKLHHLHRPTCRCSSETDQGRDRRAFLELLPLGILLIISILPDNPRPCPLNLQPSEPAVVCSSSSHLTRCKPLHNRAWKSPSCLLQQHSFMDEAPFIQLVPPGGYLYAVAHLWSLQSAILLFLLLLAKFHRWREAFSLQKSLRLQ